MFIRKNYWASSSVTREEKNDALQMAYSWCFNEVKIYYARVFIQKKRDIDISSKYFSVISEDFIEFPPVDKSIEYRI